MFPALLATDDAVAQVCMFGIFGDQDVNIRDRTTVSSALIASNTSVTMGVQSEVGGDIISGNAVFMANYAVAYSNVHFRNAIFKQEPTYIMGEERQFDPEFNMDIPVKFVDAGGQNINLITGAAPLTLPPGNYGDLHMNTGTTLILTGGVYNFTRFVVESDNATLVFDSGEDFTEINTQNELRFGDRNIFELAEGTEPEQVQFYSNTLGQIKIGTDTTFTGVITAPYGQIYAFPRSTINGNLIAKSVWVDTDSTVHPIQNCTEFNTEFDDTIILDMRDAVSFEGDGWTIADTNSDADVTLSDNYTSDGESSLEITLNSEDEVTIENAAVIDAVFSEDASDITVKLKVKSNAVPYATCNGEVSVYLKSVDDTTYTLASVLPYDPLNEYSDFMDTLSFDLSADLTELVMNENVNVSIKVSANQSCNPVFWLDELQFCDDKDGCNIQLPTMNPPDWVAPDEEPYHYDVSWNGDNSDIIVNTTTLSGAIRVMEDDPTPCTVTMQYEAVLGDRIDAILGNYMCTPGVDISFDINAADLPFNTAGMISQANIIVTTSYTNSSGTVTTFNNIADMRYYHHNPDGTITHFTEEVFEDTYDGYWFRSDPAVNNRLPLLDEDSDVVGEIESMREGVDLNGPDGPDTDTAADTETATIIYE